MEGQNESPDRGWAQKEAAAVNCEGGVSSKGSGQWKEPTLDSGFMFLGKSLTPLGMFPLLALEENDPR